MCVIWWNLCLNGWGGGLEDPDQTCALLSNCSALPSPTIGQGPPKILRLWLPDRNTQQKDWEMWENPNNIQVVLWDAVLNKWVWVWIPVHSWLLLVWRGFPQLSSRSDHKPNAYRGQSLEAACLHVKHIELLLTSTKKHVSPLSFFPTLE